MKREFSMLKGYTIHTIKREQMNASGIKSEPTAKMPYFVPFGKYAGRPIHDLIRDDIGYVLWLSGVQHTKWGEAHDYVETNHPDAVAAAKAVLLDACTSSHEVAITVANLLFSTKRLHRGPEAGRHVRQRRDI